MKSNIKYLSNVVALCAAILSMIGFSGKDCLAQTGSSQLAKAAWQKGSSWTEMYRYNTGHGVADLVSSVTLDKTFTHDGKDYITAEGCNFGLSLRDNVLYCVYPGVTEEFVYFDFNNWEEGAIVTMSQCNPKRTDEYFMLHHELPPLPAPTTLHSDEWKFPDLEVYTFPDRYCWYDFDYALICGLGFISGPQCFMAAITDGIIGLSWKGSCLLEFRDPDGNVLYRREGYQSGVDLINKVENTDNRIYDLLGREIQNPIKGNIYIKNRKKIIY